ncbi:MAG TPA: tetratricopeptide repeat protein [Rhodopila sp.]|nr:tetratricopeptide repeat protein [Rhodopila sp.]
MSLRSRLFGSAAALLVFAGPQAQAEGVTAVRAADQANLGRIVIETTGSAVYRLVRDGDHLSLRFNRPVLLGEAPPPPQNVQSVTTDGAALDVWVVPGARVHPYRQSGRVVLDIMAPLAPAAPASGRQGRPLPTAFLKSPELGGRTVVAPPAAAEAPPAPVPVQAAQLEPPAPDPSPAIPVQTAQPIAPGRDIAPEPPDSPVALLARRLQLPAGTEGTAFLAPFAATTGAAAFQDRDGVTAVFDERRPIDVSRLRDDPALAGVAVQLLANGTMIHVPVPASRFLALTPMPRGWRIALLPAAPRLQPIGVALNSGALNMALEEAGEVITMTDTQTGGTLLVGTQRRPGAGIMIPRHTAEFELRPTLQGVVLAPFSDHLTLKRSATGFQVTGGPEGLYMSAAESMNDSLVDAALLQRRFTFPAMKPAALMQLLTRQIAEAAAAPPLARGPLNHRAAETMLALGMAPEAQSLLRVAAEQDPREATSADNAALGAIAALLAGRVGEADALSDHRLDGSDEIALWRAVREAMLDEGSPGAAAVFSTTAPLALAYPDNLRDHILPLILETMVQGGELVSARHMLEERQDDPRLAYARALLRQAEGDIDGALALLDSLAQDRDPFDSSRAAVRAVELRLANKKLTTEQAADALDRLLYLWRGDARELALREHLAELRAKTSRWADALELLRQAETDFPAQASSIHERLLETFAAMIHDTNGQHLRPIEFVSLVDENADLLGDNAITDGVDQQLADDLLTLDLPQRAKTVLENLIKRSTADIAKGRYGYSLAAIRAREGDAAGALATLDAYAGGPLPDDLAENRLLLRAASKAQLGDTAAAIELLATLHTRRAVEERAHVLENAQDWAGAEQAWADCVALTVPATGTLDEAQTQTVLRLASATARARDDAGLAALRARFGTRIGPGPLGDMFRLLTAQPVRTTADIARSGKEATLAAALPSSLAALKAEPVPR